MKDLSPCVHILPGKTDVITGGKSTLRLLKRDEKTYYHTCSVCSKELETSRYNQLIGKIIRAAADGKRRDDLHYFHKDVIQPQNERGEENEHFTRAWGWNPSAKDETKRRTPEEQAEDTRNAEFGSVPEGGNDSVGKAQCPIQDSPEVDGGSDAGA